MDENIKPVPVTMTMEEARIYIGISYEKLRLMAVAGEIPCISCGRRKLFRKATLDAWMDEQEKKAVQPIDDEDSQYGKLRKIY